MLAYGIACSCSCVKVRVAAHVESVADLTCCSVNVSCIDIIVPEHGTGDYWLAKQIKLVRFVLFLVAERGPHSMKCKS